MLLWIILAALTAIVLLVLLRPLVGGGRASSAREAFDAAVYRDQLGEIEADRARGLIGEEEAEAARRRDRAPPACQPTRTELTPSPQDCERQRTCAAAMIAVAVALPLLALGLYLVYGSPRLPDQPLAARLQDPASDQNLEALVARVEARLREHPEEGEGWDVMAPGLYGLAALCTMRPTPIGQAIRLLGRIGEAPVGHGQALVLANDGVVTEEARNRARAGASRSIRVSSSRVSCSPSPRSRTGSSPRRSRIGARCWPTPRPMRPGGRWSSSGSPSDEAMLAGKPVARREGSGRRLRELPGARGPSAGDVAAAQNMNPADRQAMIETMVNGLPTRLDAGRQTILPAGSSWSEPIACSTGRMTP